MNSGNMKEKHGTDYTNPHYTPMPRVPNNNPLVPAHGGTPPHGNEQQPDGGEVGQSWMKPVKTIMRGSREAKLAAPQCRLWLRVYIKVECCPNQS